MPLKSATLPHFWRAKRVWSRGVLPATLCRWAMGCTSRRLVDIGEPWKYLEIKAISVCRWEVWTLNRKNDHFRSPVALGYAKIWHNWIIWSLWVYIYIYLYKHRFIFPRPLALPHLTGRPTEPSEPLRRPDFCTIYVYLRLTCSEHIQCPFKN